MEGTPCFYGVPQWPPGGQGRAWSRQSDRHTPSSLRVCKAPQPPTPGARSPTVSGGYIGGVLPVPIPNTEVKPSRADGTGRPACGRVGRCRNFLQDAPPLHPSRGASPFQPTKRLQGAREEKGSAGEMLVKKKNPPALLFTSR